MDGKMKKENNYFNVEYTELTELKTIYDHALSFYKKAHVKKYYNKENIIIKYQLISYNTIMIEYDASLKGNKQLIFNKHLYNYTNTTLRHVKEFIKQYNHLFIMYDRLYKKDYVTKKDIISYLEA